MVFRFYSEQLSKATRGLASLIFIIGMMLIGFGVLIYTLPKLFAILAATVFFVAGLSCLGYAIKLFCAIGRMRKDLDRDAYRQNVTIHEGHLEE